MDDLQDIIAFYDRNAENEHARLDRHQLEYDLTWRYLDQYLPASGSILEIGAATGRYTLGLARRGYTVTAVDMSSRELEACRNNLTAEGLESQVRLVLADARDLSVLGGQEFDAVLLMGPLYHLFNEAERRLAVQQAYDRLRQGGPLFSAFISRYGLLGDVMRKIPGWIENQVEVRSVLAEGKDPTPDHPSGEFRGYFARVSEIAPLHEALGLETLAVAAVEPAISAYDESYNQLEGRQRALWLDLLYEISTEPSIIGASRRLLYIGCKA